MFDVDVCVCFKYYFVEVGYYWSQENSDDKRKGCLRYGEWNDHNCTTPTVLKHQNGTHDASELTCCLTRPKLNPRKYHQFVQVYLRS